MGIFKYTHVDGQAEKVSVQHEIDWKGEERGLGTRGNGENSRHLMSKIELGLRGEREWRVFVWPVMFRLRN